jgi:hypothetical protein
MTRLGTTLRYIPDQLIACRKEVSGHSAVKTEGPIQLDHIL